jgi:hypothetical protein
MKNSCCTIVLSGTTSKRILGRPNFLRVEQKTDSQVIRSVPSVAFFQTLGSGTIFHVIWNFGRTPDQGGVVCRGVVTMTQPCMLSYSLLLIKTCHRRGVHAMGGMAAQIPIKNDPQANEAALIKVPPPLIL